MTTDLKLNPKDVGQIPIKGGAICLDNKKLAVAPVTPSAASTATETAAADVEQTTPSVINILLEQEPQQEVEQEEKHMTNVRYDIGDSTRKGSIVLFHIRDE